MDYAGRFGIWLALASFGVGACAGGNRATKEAICTAGSAFKHGTQAFVESTDKWQLDGVGGVRLSAVDVNGDGWTDLIVRRGGVRVDSFSQNERHTWLLINKQGKFEDFTEESGILAARGASGNRPAEVFAFGDVDNDGDLDAYTGTNTADDNAIAGQTSELLLNDGSGKFTLASENLPLRQADGFENVSGASFIDVNLDGNLDLWVTRFDYQNPNTGANTFDQDKLYLGDGKGGFSDATEQLGLSTKDWQELEDINKALAHSRSWGGAACDLNNDGAPELTSGNYGRSPNHLWQASRTENKTTYANRSIESGYAFDSNQSWQSNEFAKCYCSNNPGAEGCDGVLPPRIGCQQDNWNHSRDRQPYRNGGNSSGAVCADLNNDGFMDLMTSEIRHWWAGEASDGSELLINTGESDVSFERLPDNKSGLEIAHTSVSWDEGHMTAGVFDFDNDGWLDTYTGASDYNNNRGLLHRQRAPLEFEAVSVEDGIDHSRSHGLAIADFDRDGDQDIIVGHSRARCGNGECYPTSQVRLFENTAGNGGNWLQVQLRGKDGSNAAAIGARIELEYGDTTQSRQIDGGHGHFGIQHDLVQHFGLGTECEAKVTVFWPDAENTKQEFTLVSGYRFVLDKKEGIVDEIPAQ